MYKKLSKRESKLAVIGLGYVGLPIALEFARKISVIGFDINQKRIDLMKKKIDPSNELEKKDFEGCDISFTTSLDELRKANFLIVTVPTPIDEHNLPDLKPLIGASTSVGKVLKKGDYVVYESTVYPGCTEEDCIPVLEQHSKLKFKKDFKVGYSPERINPGDKNHTITNVKKVVSGCDDESLEEVAKVYEMIVKAGVHRAPTIKVAEAAKIIENTQRDLNIALMNELSIIFSKMDINTFDVLEAAGTKWNFLKFYPGLVGGHCIGVDPYYLTHKAESLGYHARVINAGRYVNDSMGFYVAKNTVKKIISSGKDISKAKVLVMGATFKEDVTDIRNSKVADVVKELKSYSVQVDVTDPHADSDELMHEYGFGLVKMNGKNYDAVIVAVNHKDYLKHDEKYFKSILTSQGILVDIKGIYRGKIKNISYWSL
ncbi:MAG: nucleotide sugar dehydrogenase [Bacteroidetes bacterium]|nr:nucleotide sugar dehydrogenase [Bacteroidota bacterium]